MSSKALLLVFLFYTMMALALGAYSGPCSVTCSNGGHTPTCCRSHGYSGGHCSGGDAYCT